MTRKQRRLVLIGSALTVLAIAAALVLNALRDSIVFFSTPSMAAEKNIQPGQRFRLGGLVQPGSLVRGEQLQVKFAVTDGNASLPVAFTGILPDLFREGQGVISEGALDASGVFKADTVLAKHDETYMPKDVADALKKQGHWKDGGCAKGDGRQGCHLQPRCAMIVEAGHYALVLALALALVQSIVPMIGARLGEPTLMGVAGSTAVAQFAFALFAFGALTIAYVVSDFSVVNVFENSHSAKPLIYKITGVWGNHEGSMLLWVLILALFSALVAIFGSESAVGAALAGARGAGLDRRGLLSVHSRHLESVPAHRRSADRGQGPQSGAAGHRPRACIRRCSISAMSASRSRSRLRSQR